MKLLKRAIMADYEIPENTPSRAVGVQFGANPSLLGVADRLIDDANRATELRLNPVVRPATLLLSPAIHLEFIALRENTTIRTLQHPLILSFLKPASYAILPFVRYDNRIYRNPLHIQEDEVCRAILEMATWVCMI